MTEQRMVFGWLNVPHPVAKADGTGGGDNPNSMQMFLSKLRDNIREVVADGDLTEEDFASCVRKARAHAGGMMASRNRQMATMDMSKSELGLPQNTPEAIALAKAAPLGSLEYQIGEIAEDFNEQFPNVLVSDGIPPKYKYIVATYPDEQYVIVSEGGEYYRYDWVTTGPFDAEDDGDGDYVFTRGSELAQTWVAKRLPKRDRQNQRVPLEELEKAAYDFVLDSREGDDMHEGPPVSRLVESFVVTDEKLEKMGVPEEVRDLIPRGWWGGFKVDDNATWELVKTGERPMFSIAGSGFLEPTDDTDE